MTKTADYTFKFDIGLSPEIELNISSADKYEKYSILITDKMLDEEIERMMKRFSQLTDVETVGENDMIYVGLTELNEDGSELDGGVHPESVPVAINTIKNEDLSKQLMGLEKGAELTVNIFSLFNNDEQEMSHALGIQKPGIADLSPHFKLILKEIKHTENSELNQEFFDKLYGKDVITSEVELRTKISEELKTYFDQQAQHLMEHELFDSLVAKHNIMLPDAFLKRWLIDRHTDKFNASNIDKAYIPEANYLKNHILEEKIMLANDIKVDETEIKEAAMGHTKSMFGSYGNQGISDELLWSIVEPQLKKEDFRSRMINVAVRQKVNAYLMDTITVEPKDISAEDFFKIMETHNHKHHDHEQGNSDENEHHDPEHEEAVMA